MNLRWARPLAAVAVLLLGAVAVTQYRAERAARARDRAQWASSGAAEEHAAAASRADGDPDPGASPLGLARVLLADAYDLHGLAALPAAQAAARARRAESDVELIARTGEAMLRARPASWEAAMLLGGARLLATWRETGGEIYRQPERWREPLRHATRLAPGNPEPRRLLLAGTLASWHALPDRERADARSLLRTAFADRATLDELLPAWAVLAADDAELESVLPPGPHPYELLQQLAAGRGDWPAMCAARARLQPRLRAALERTLNEADRRLAGGDLAGGRQQLLTLIATAPPDQRMAPLLARAVELLPPGPISPADAAALDRWLAWALPLWQLGLPTLPAPALARMAGLSAELPAETAAWAAAAAGDLDRAEALERRADRSWSEEWAPYVTAKARLLIERGDLDAAAAALADVQRMYQTRWPYLHVRAQLAQARREAAPAIDPGTDRWPAVGWLYHGQTTMLEMIADRPAGGIEVEIAAAPAAGGAVELALDGRDLGCVPVAAGRSLRAHVAVAPGPHQLVWRPLASGLAPGTVMLAAPADGG